MTPLDFILMAIFAALMIFYMISIIAIIIYIVQNQRNPVPLMCRDKGLDFADLDVEYLHPISDIL